MTPNRLPTVTLVGRTINLSIQCVAMRRLWSDLDADQASDPTPKDKLIRGTQNTSSLAQINARLEIGGIDTQLGQRGKASGRLTHAVSFHS